MRWTRCSLLAASLIAAAACGSGAEPGAGAPESAGSAPAAPAPAEPQQTLGGGRATQIHPGDAGSPHVKVDWAVDGADISITYGRPYLKGRVVGESVEPMEGRVWRLGADEATILTTERDLMIGETHVPAGQYTLWVLDRGDTWDLIVNSQTGQWGTSYDQAQDFARIPMTVTETNTPADQLILSIDGGEFKVEWGRMVATVPLQVHQS